VASPEPETNDGHIAEFAKKEWYTPQDLGIRPDGDGSRDGYLSQLVNHERLARRVRAIVAAKDPDLWNKFEDSINHLAVIAELAGAVRQGRVIEAALRGDLTAWPGCVPKWFNKPLDCGD